MSLALNTINRLAPDPLGLGSQRVLISEYGLFENDLPGQTVWRAQTILQTAKGAGLLGAFLCNVFYNECTDSNGRADLIGLLPGDPNRPQNRQCRGLWAVRPDWQLEFRSQRAENILEQLSRSKSG